MEDLQTDFSHLETADWAQFAGAATVGLFASISSTQQKPLLTPCGWQFGTSISNALYFYSYMAVYMDEGFADWRYMVPMTWLFTKFTDSIRAGECDGTPSQGFYAQLNNEPGDIVNYLLDFSYETTESYMKQSPLYILAVEYLAPASQTTDSTNAFVKVLMLLAIVANIAWSSGQSYIAYYHYVNRFAVSEFFEAGAWLGRLIVFSVRSAYFTLLMFILGFTL